MAMSRKDYKLIAAVFREAMEHFVPINSYGGYVLADASFYDIGDVVIRIANALEANNPNFDRARFLAACGLREEGTIWKPVSE